LSALDGNWAGWNKDRIGGERWRGKIAAAPHAHPLVRQLIEEANEQRVTITDLSIRTGIRRETISRWRQSSSPGVQNLIACFNVLGLELIVAPVKERG
jgi:hypothetical protein